MVELEAREILTHAGSGPGDLHGGDGGGIAQTDFLSERRGPETAATVDGLINGARAI